MKKVLIFGLVGILSSCGLDKQILSVDEQKEWSVKNDTIYYKNQSIGYYDHFEYELNPSHGRSARPIIELSITQLKSGQDNLEGLIRFVHTKHRKQKVEIVVPKN